VKRASKNIEFGAIDFCIELQTVAYNNFEKMADLILGQTLAEKYRVDRALRASGLGRIYSGMHLRIDKPVTIKILSPALAIDDSIVKRFSEEARTVSHISHPNVLNVTDFGSDKDVVYIIFESVEGETLKEAVLREGKFSLENARDIVRQIAAGLSAAHKKGFVHGHLKSENVLLAKTADESDLVKILEFGSTTKDHDELSLKDLEYLAPEQNSSVSEMDARSDIYSLGVILYEMLAGEVPFTAENPTALMLKQAEEPPPPLSAFRDDLPYDLEPVVLRALAKNPELRYQTAGEFADDLLGISAAKTMAAKASGNVWKTFSIILVGIIALSALLIYALSSKQRNPETMQTDAGSQPVQPINPATGINEQGLSNMMAQPFDANINMNIPPGTLPGGDGVNPWANPEKFQQVPEGGQMTNVPTTGGCNPIMPAAVRTFSDGSVEYCDGAIVGPDGTIRKKATVNSNTNSSMTNPSNVDPKKTNTQSQDPKTPSDNPQKPTEVVPSPTKKPGEKTKPATDKTIKSGDKKVG